MKPATFIILIVTLWPASSLAHQTRCNLTGWDDPVSPCQGSCSSSQAIYEQRPAGSRTYEYSSYTITAQTFESRCVYPNQTPGRWYPAQEQIQTFTCKSGYQWDDRNHICIRATCTATQQWNPATARCESACPTGTTFALTEANPQGICQLDCPAGYYRLSDSECQRCGSGTELVITPDDRSGTCLPFCPLGHLRNISGNCEPLLCPDGQVLHNGDCLPACPTGHIRNEAGHCEALLCRAGMVVFQGQCREQCPGTQQYDALGQCTSQRCPLGQTRNSQGRCQPLPAPDDNDNDSDADDDSDNGNDDNNDSEGESTTTTNNTTNNNTTNNTTNRTIINTTTTNTNGGSGDGTGTGTGSGQGEGAGQGEGEGDTLSGPDAFQLTEIDLPDAEGIQGIADTLTTIDTSTLTSPFTRLIDKVLAVIWSAPPSSACPLLGYSYGTGERAYTPLAQWQIVCGWLDFFRGLLDLLVASLSLFACFSIASKLTLRP